jgi:hypothetical protein
MRNTVIVTRDSSKLSKVPIKSAWPSRGRRKLSTKTSKDNALMLKRRKHGNGLMAEINITPFTDVVLVLLIIFMLAAPFSSAAAGIPWIGYKQSWKMNIAMPKDRFELPPQIMALLNE